MAIHDQQMDKAEKARKQAPRHGRKTSVAQRIYRDEMLAKYPLSPVEYMLKLMNDRRNPHQLRLEAAKAAAPYLHAKVPQEIQAEFNHNHQHHHRHEVTATQQWIYDVLDLPDERSLTHEENVEKLSNDAQETPEESDDGQAQSTGDST